ncbi:MAG: cyanophycinase, partial [Pirellulaceae bacterium]|nr:cyanophycinase [Pirellulaceae bacterium]
QWLQKQAPDLHACVQRGGVVLGCGDVCRLFGSQELVPAQPDISSSQVTSLPGLNLLPDVILQTNFAGNTAKPTLLKILTRFPKAIGIGMEPQTQLILRGRKVAAQGTGQLHFFTAANSRLPVREKTIAGSKNPRSNPYESLVDLTAWRRDAIDRTREIFPSAKPAIPCVPKGTLMIIGGGGMPAGLMEQFVERAGGKNARLIYVPCTERETLSSRDSRLVQSWRQQGVASADVFHTKDRLKANQDEAFLKPLTEATGIFFGGGRQWNFSDSYYGTQAHRLMKEVLQRGGVIAGSSAGASIQARYLARANPLGNRDIMATGYERGGLGFISGVAIDQHFTQRRRQTDMSDLVDRYPQLLGIGIDERTALLVQKSRAKVIGDGDVYFYDRNKRSAEDKPDFLKLEAGKEYDLAKREIVSPE